MLDNLMQSDSLPFPLTNENSGDVCSYSDFALVAAGRTTTAARDEGLVDLPRHEQYHPSHVESATKNDVDVDVHRPLTHAHTPPPWSVLWHYRAAMPWTWTWN